jgi:nucleoside-diphosphate-sugar epimerase
VFRRGETGHRLAPDTVSTVSHGDRAELTSGDQVRDFVYVAGVVEAFVSFADADTSRLARNHRSRAIAELAVRHLGAGATMLKFGAKQPRIGEAPYVVGDSSALSTGIGWRAQVPISNGVRDTVR